jgi:hypothetical protein
MSSVVPVRPFAVEWPTTTAGTAGRLSNDRQAPAAIGLRDVVERATCAEWAAGVTAVRAEWTADFGGEQFTLGRAFYTHFETDRSEEYFRDAAASDALVERVLPGMQGRMRALFGELVGGIARPRRGWCGPGVHVFPSGGEVAARGGVVHFDTEGLTERHARDRRPALTLVVMLQPAESGGGLKLWDVRYRGRDRATRAELAKASVVAAYEAGTGLLIDSYRLHQIQPFGGARDRVSITIHGALVDAGVWETWF